MSVITEQHNPGLSGLLQAPAAGALVAGLPYGEAIRRISRGPADSQRDYRQLIAVLGEPGTIGQIDTVEAVPPVITVAAGLADVDVTVALLDEVWQRPFLIATGATRAEATSAQHVIATSALSIAQLSQLCTGDALHPENGARVFAAVDGLGTTAGQAGPGAAELRLSGPGIVGERRLFVSGLSVEFFDALMLANADFPAGIDLIMLTPAGQMAAIARSTHIQLSEPGAAAPHTAHRTPHTAQEGNA